MSIENLTLLKTPAREISAGNVSVWGAAFNPLVFNYQRRDFEVLSVASQTADQIKVIIDAILTDDEAESLVDSFVKMKTALYDDTFLVEGVTVVPPDMIVVGWTEILLNSPGHSVTDTTGYLNSDLLRASWSVKTNLTVNGKVYVLTHSADREGFVRSDMSGILKELVNSDDYYKNDQFNYFDNNLFVKYSLVYVWQCVNMSGESLGGTIQSGGEYYATHSALQLQNGLGSNMGAYVPFLIEPNPDKLAKWLSVFDEPVYNVGLPFDLAFIYSEKLAGKKMYVRFKPLDINKKPFSGAGVIDDILLNINAVDSLLINSIDVAVVGSSGGKGVAINPDDVVLINDVDALLTGNENVVEDKELTEGVGVCRITFTDLFSELVKYVQVYVFYKEGGEDDDPLINWSNSRLDDPSYNARLEIKEATTSLVDVNYSSFGGGESIHAGQPFSIKASPYNAPLPVAVFNWTLDEAVSAPFIDCNLKIEKDSATLVEVFNNASGSVNMEPGRTYTITGWGVLPAVGADWPKLRMTVTQSGVVVYDNQVDYDGTNVLVYSGPAPIGETLVILVQTFDGIGPEAGGGSTAPDVETSGAGSLTSGADLYMGGLSGDLVNWELIDGNTKLRYIGTSSISKDLTLTCSGAIPPGATLDARIYKNSSFLKKDVIFGPGGTDPGPYDFNYFQSSMLINPGDIFRLQFNVLGGSGASVDYGFTLSFTGGTPLGGGSDEDFIPINHDPAPVHPQLKLEVKKDGSTIFLQVVPYEVGNVLEYTGVWDIDALYEVNAATQNNRTVPTPINITEDPDIEPGVVTERIVTQTKTIKICRPDLCPDKYVYVKWLNKLAGWEYFLFTYDIDYAQEIADRSYYEFSVLDYETQRETENVLFTTARDIMGLSRTEVTASDLRALSTMDTSPKAYILVVINPFTWLGVSVDAKSSNLFNSNDMLGTYSRNIKLPTKNLQF